MVILLHNNNYKAI